MLLAAMAPNKPKLLQRSSSLQQERSIATLTLPRKNVRHASEERFSTATTALSELPKEQQKPSEQTSRRYSSGC